MPTDTKYQTTPSEQRAIQVEVYESFDRLKSLQSEWDEFMESLNCEIFLTFDWCRLWWKYYGEKRKLRIYIFRHQNNIVALIPMFFGKIRIGPVCVKTGKIVGSDCILSQFSMPIDHDYLNEVLIKFYESISYSDWDIIHWGPIAGLYEHFNQLKTYLENNSNTSCTIHIEDDCVQTYFLLADSWEEYLSLLSKRDRGDVKRNYKYIQKVIGKEAAGVEASFADIDNLKAIFDEFVRTHQIHWHKLGKGGHFGDWPKSRDFHFEVAKTQVKYGRLKLLKVTINNICLGYEYNYKFGNKYYEFLNARSDSKEMRHISLGKIMFGELVKKAQQENIQYIDSMRGKYVYKLRMGGKLYTMKRVYFCRNKLPTLIRIRIFRCLIWLLHMCYYNIWFRRIAPRLPFKRRGLWKLWMRTQMFR